MSSFKLKSGDTEFNTRVDALFSSLQTVAKDLEPQVKRKHEDIEQDEDDEPDDDGERRRPFRRPEGRPPQWRGRGGGSRGRGGGPRNSTPDYVKNPEKWTRYKMSDTRVLSDAENRQEGLKLLADLEARPDKVTEDQEMDVEEFGHPKIVFKKPSVSSVAETVSSKPVQEEDDEEEEEKEDEAEEFSAEFGGSKKFVMQEYVVGKTKPKSKGKLASESKVASEKEKKEVKLSYLMFEEED